MNSLILDLQPNDCLLDNSMVCIKSFMQDIAITNTNAIYDNKDKQQNNIERSDTTPYN